jgi:multicomponent Na+:H+ antiporter subunit F
MTRLCLVVALILLLIIALGLIRILRGPTATDRMLTAQLFATTAVAILLLLGFATKNPVINDVALVFALLTAIAAVTFVRRTSVDDTAPQQGDDDDPG